MSINGSFDSSITLTTSSVQKVKEFLSLNNLSPTSNAKTIDSPFYLKAFLHRIYLLLDELILQICTVIDSINDLVESDNN